MDHADAVDPHVIPPVYLTDDIPGIGGAIKERPEDFLVEELPLYQPSGSGEHVYLFVQKRGMTTLQAARVLARHFNVHPSAVGHAGLKDRRAITRQVFSIHVPGKKPEDFPMLQHEHMAVLWADLHANKLRTGHLAGNRFVIKVRRVDPTAARRADAALARLAAVGVPNRIGEQRFGYLLRNHLVGRAILLDDAQAALDAILGPGPMSIHDDQAEGRRLYASRDFVAALHAFGHHSRTERRILGELARRRSAAQALRAVDRQEVEFFLSALQSAAFNDVLDQRLRASTIARLLPGDLAFKHDNRAVFAVPLDRQAPDADPAAGPASDLVERLARLEISPSGPMWGADMIRAQGDIDRAELEALARFDLAPDHLAAFDAHRRGRISGARRPLRVPISSIEVEGGADADGTYVRCAFDLPRGAFATTVLREIMKPDRVGTLADDEDEP
ncbi:MAG: tRNA pseudouridine(13) synthase TruD [Phycisphaerales bacterium]